MTVVRPELQFGVARLDRDGLISGFDEKPRSEHWINGGFFCMRPAVFEQLAVDSVLEREPLGQLAAAGALRGFRHDGFWECMDTYKDAVVLNDLWNGGRAPWKLWELNGRTALVTGAHGLLGGWLVKALLDAGVLVVTIRRDEPTTSALEMLGLGGRVDTVRGDICEDGLIARALNEYDVDSVFHLAAQTLVGTANRSPLSTFETNIRGTWLLLEACRLHGAQAVIVASSDKAYGRQEQLPYDERQALAPTFPYDVSKAAADLLARSYWHTYELPVAVTRFANLYGGGDTNRSRLIPEAVGAALAGRSPVIRSDGSPERDFLYVRGRRRRLPGDLAGAAGAARAGERRSTPAAARHTGSATLSH